MAAGHFLISQIRILQPVFLNNLLQSLFKDVTTDIYCRNCNFLHVNFFVCAV